MPKKSSLPKTKDLSLKSMDKLLSVNVLLILVIFLELLLALYLILSQSLQLSSLKAVVGGTPSSQSSNLPTSETPSEPQASMSLSSASKTFTVGEKTDIEVVLDMDKAEKLSAVEGWVKYDPDYFKVDGVITRSLFVKGVEKDDPANGIYQFTFYNKDGQLVEKSLGVATLTVTPLRQGKTNLTLLTSNSTVSSSKVMRYENPINLLNTVKGLEVEVE
jgi:hypothetical protein